VFLSYFVSDLPILAGAVVIKLESIDFSSSKALSLKMTISNQENVLSFFNVIAKKEVDICRVLSLFSIIRSINGKIRKSMLSDRKIRSQIPILLSFSIKIPVRRILSRVAQHLLKKKVKSTFFVGFFVQ